MIQFGKDYYEFCKEKHNFDMKAKGGWQTAYASYIVHIFQNLTGKKCLDFGCAMGSQTSALMDAGLDIVGVDVSEFYVKECPFDNVKNRLSSYTDKLPYEDKTFDFIHTSQVIEHIPEERLPHILRELRRVLKDDGIIYISTCHENEHAGHDGDDPTHCSALSRDLWTKLFNEAGLDIHPELNAFEERWLRQVMFHEYKWNQFVLAPKKSNEVLPEVPVENKTVTTQNIVNPTVKVGKKGKK